MIKNDRTPRFEEMLLSDLSNSMQRYANCWSKKIPPNSAQNVHSRCGECRLITTEPLLRIHPMNVHCFEGTRISTVWHSVGEQHIGAKSRRWMTYAQHVLLQFNWVTISIISIVLLCQSLLCWDVVCSVVVLFLSLSPPSSAELCHILQFRWVHWTKQQLPYHQQQQDPTPAGNLIRITSWWSTLQYTAAGWLFVVFTEDSDLFTSLLILTSSTSLSNRQQFTFQRWF